MSLSNFRQITDVLDFNFKGHKLWILLFCYNSKKVWQKPLNLCTQVHIDQGSYAVTFLFHYIYKCSLSFKGQIFWILLFCCIQLGCWQDVSPYTLAIFLLLQAVCSVAISPTFLICTLVLLSLLLTLNDNSNSCMVICHQFTWQSVTSKFCNGDLSLVHLVTCPRGSPLCDSVAHLSVSKPNIESTYPPSWQPDVVNRFQQYYQVNLLTYHSILWIYLMILFSDVGCKILSLSDLFV